MLGLYPRGYRRPCEAELIGISPYGPTNGARLGSRVVEERRHEAQPNPQVDRRPLLRIATRLAFIQEAEEKSRQRINRPLTAHELRRILGRYPGD
jgi:hypothetical protein